MPYNQEHMVLQWGGTVRNGDSPTAPLLEIFSGTLRFAGPGLDAANNKNTATALGAVLARYWASNPASIPKRHYLEFVKWNRVTTAGLYASDVNTNLVTIEPTPGGRPYLYPLQVTWATTWGTDSVRGKAVRGRTFWPTAVPVGGDFKANAQDALTKSAADNQLIKDLNQAARSAYVSPIAGGGYEPWLVALGFAPGTIQEGSGMSAMVMSKIGAGTSRVITHSEVGTRLDVQRRRANGQVDVRIQAPQ